MHYDIYIHININTQMRAIKVIIARLLYIDGLVQDHSISSALAMEILQFCT